MGLRKSGWWLDVMILKVFSSLNDSVVLCWAVGGLQNSSKGVIQRDMMTHFSHPPSSLLCVHRGTVQWSITCVQGSFELSPKENLEVTILSHTWFGSRCLFVEAKWISDLFSKEICFKSQRNLTPWIGRDSAWFLRQKYIPFLKWLGESSDLCGKAREMAGGKREITCISGLCLPDIYKLWVMQLRENCSHSKKPAWFKRT